MYVEIVIVVPKSSSATRDVEAFVGPFCSAEERNEYIRRAQAKLPEAGLNPNASKYISCKNIPRRKKWEKWLIVGDLVEGMQSKPFMHVRSIPRKKQPL